MKFLFPKLSAVPLNFIPIVILAAFMVIAIFGVSFGMQTDKMGNMADCPWANNASSICPMNVGEHIAKWQQLFTVNPRQDAMATLFTILSAAVAIFAIRRLEIFDFFIRYYQRYKQEHPNVSLFNYLRVILAGGILEPRLYA